MCNVNITNKKNFFADLTITTELIRGDKFTSPWDMSFADPCNRVKMKVGAYINSNMLNSGIMFNCPVDDDDDDDDDDDKLLFQNG